MLLMSAHAKLSGYLRRMGLQDTPPLDSSELRRVHYHHLLTVPFENLSIHANESIVLSDETLVEKIVGRHRGGFCYELNGAFSWLLTALGYPNYFVSAEVAHSDGTYSPPHDHMAVLVDAPIPLLADVGFGDSFRYPLKLLPDTIQEEPGAAYRFVLDGDKYVLHRKILDGPWTPQFRFTLQPYRYSDFQDMCDFHSKSPDSHFRKEPMATLATPEGRITVSAHKFIETSLTGLRREMPVASDADFDTILERCFNIKDWRT